MVTPYIIFQDFVMKGHSYSFATLLQAHYDSLFYEDNWESFEVGWQTLSPGKFLCVSYEIIVPLKNKFPKQRLEQCSWSDINCVYCKKWYKVKRESYKLSQMLRNIV